MVFSNNSFLHLTKDLTNGCKLIRMSTKQRHHHNRGLRFFVGGLLLILLTTYALYATVVYNYAIARSETDVIVNAVIILFLTDLDEQTC